MRCEAWEDFGRLVRGRFRALAPVLLAGAALAGCAAMPHADFSHLYSQRAGVARRPPLIVIPGVMGSRLVQWKGGREVWPGRIPALLTGRSFCALSVPLLDPDPVADPAALTPGGIFDEVGGHSFYSDLVRALEDFGHYQCAPPEAIDAATDCVLFSWDWRLDFVEAARRLEGVVERIRQVRLDPELRVDVIAHSAGGLVARYYLRYGGRDVLDAEVPAPPDLDGHGIDRLILIGTPNFGSIAAVQQAMFGKTFPLGLAGPEVLATFPGLPELFPHPRLDWMIEADGLPAAIDLFAIATWRDNRVGIFAPAARLRLRDRLRDDAEVDRYLRAAETSFAASLRRGERFQRALAIPLEQTDVGFYVFGSGCIATPARCLVEREGGALALRSRPEDIRHPLPGIDYSARMLEPGDGSVTKSSLLGLPSLVDGRPGPAVFPVTAAVFICAPHESLSSNPTFLDNLLHVLLYRGPRPQAPAVPEAAPGTPFTPRPDF
ncbi:MAG: esterase/lipase family protein [Thermoanaerobaculia bacterium]